MKHFDKIHDGIKNKAFGKSKISRGVKRKDSIVDKDDNKKNFNNAKALFEEEENIAKHKIKEISFKYCQDTSWAWVRIQRCKGWKK